jgi:hypothetical protein
MTKTTSYITRTYRKIYVLSGLVAALALIYAATLIFDPERVNTRDSSFVWLDEKWVDQADAIEITSNGQSITLARRNGEREASSRWLVSRDNGYGSVDYPAKQLRVEDLLHVLSAKGAYPVRANTSHERFGLTEAAADHIVIRGGLSQVPLLDLLIGDTDTMGAVYMRKNKQDEVRSGMNSTLASYASSAVTSWYNLRLFPDDASAGGASSGSSTASGSKAPIGIDAVQRVVIQAPAVTDENMVSDTSGTDTVSDTIDGTGESAAANASSTTAPVPPPVFTLTRNEGGWLVSDTGGEQNADTQSVESYIRTLLDIEGEDFFSTVETSGNSAAGNSASFLGAAGNSIADNGATSNSAVGNNTAGNSAVGNSAASGWVRLELGDGNTREIKLAPAPEQENRYHAIAQGSGARSGFVFVMSEWRKNTLFRDVSYFVKQ